MSTTSILPTSINPNGQIVFLLGRDIQSNLWSDFAGKKNIGETDQEIAIREFTKKTICLWANNEDMKKIFKTKRKVKQYKINEYTLYLVFFPYEFIDTQQLNRVYSYISDKHTFDKDATIWFTPNEVLESEVVNIDFRSHIQSIYTDINKEEVRHKIYNNLNIKDLKKIMKNTKIQNRSAYKRKKNIINALIGDQVLDLNT